MLHPSCTSLGVKFLCHYIQVRVLIRLSTLRRACRNSHGNNGKANTQRFSQALMFRTASLKLFYLLINRTQRVAKRQLIKTALVPHILKYQPITEQKWYWTFFVKQKNPVHP